jgi:hypothetical protein
MFETHGKGPLAVGYFAQDFSHISLYEAGVGQKVQAGVLARVGNSGRHRFDAQHRACAAGQ